LDLKEYQEFCKTTAIYPDVYVLNKTPGLGIEKEEFIKASYIYPVLGLGGEGGEILNKVQKFIRDQGGNMSEADVESIKKELGDVLWYVATICTEVGTTLEDVLEANVKKLSNRDERGVLGGSGDNR